MAYAEKTRVPVSQTKAEIETLCDKHGASSFASFSDADSVAIAFGMKKQRLLFRLPMGKDASPQEARARWRGLLLCIKAKLDGIERGIETFEEAFLAHIMMADGTTIADHATPRLNEIASGDVPLLPSPRRDP